MIGALRIDWKEIVVVRGRCVSDIDMTTQKGY